MKFIRSILIISNILAVIFLFLTYVTYYVKPHSFWFFEFIAIGYPVYLVVNLIFILLWLFSKHKKYALVSFLSIVIGYQSLCSYISLGKPATSTEAKELLIVSYNVDAFKYFGWRHSEDIQNQVFLYLQSQHPDIICFQEFHHDTQEPFVLLDSVTQAFEMKYIAKYHFHEIPGRYFYGNVIVSRYPIITKGVLEFQGRGNSCVWADVVVDEDTIRILSMHLESYRLSPKDIEVLEETAQRQTSEKGEYTQIATKLKQAIEFRSLQTEELQVFFQKTPYPMIICGDFNAPPYSHTYRTIRKASNTKDAFLEAGRGVGGTLHWNLPSMRLDYILFSNNWECTYYASERLPISDHYPISAKIKIP